MAAASAPSSDDPLSVLTKKEREVVELICLGYTNKDIASILYISEHTADYSMWRNDYHLNYNFIATFYGLCSANRSSMMLPAAKAIMEYVPVGIERASKPFSPPRTTAAPVKSKMKLRCFPRRAEQFPLRLRGKAV